MTASEDRAWMVDAACLDTDPDVFFPTSRRGDHTAYARAKAICAGCDVRIECLEYALANLHGFGDTGVWGGTSDTERRRIQRQRRKATA